MKALLIDVRLLDSRYHGVGDWPPSPFRLFQALVAGAYGGRWCVEDPSVKEAAFRWLEALEPPVVVAPHRTAGRMTKLYVPHNDADAIDGDPLRMADIRAEKQVKPALLPHDAVLRYAWPFSDGEDHAVYICSLATRLHTLGRGIDPAFASARVAEWGDAEKELGLPGAIIWRPTEGAAGVNDPRVPMPGSLDSLRVRYAAAASRFERRIAGRTVSTLFRQPPKARCRTVGYNRLPVRIPFELRPSRGSTTFASVSLTRAHDVAVAVRDLVASRLSKALPERQAEIERYVIGRGATPADVGRRLRVIPLPSIGFAMTNPSIRRVLVEVPHECPLGAADVEWALSGRPLPEFERVDEESGEVEEVLLAPTDDRDMMRHYGIGDDEDARTWRSVTPIAVPVHPSGPRRSGSQRVSYERNVSSAIRTALRHAGLDPAGATVRVQREPFTPRGRVASAFASGRFKPAVLHHAEVTFVEPVSGPIILGDGRYLGLGLMAPVRQARGAFAFDVLEGLESSVMPRDVTAALRRAVMSRAQDVLRSHLPMFFTGHERDGAPSRRPSHAHLTFGFHPGSHRLLVIAPHVVEHRRPTAEEREHLDVLERALGGLAELRAGRAGKLVLRPVPVDLAQDVLFATARTWETVVPYVATRHVKHRDAAAALRDDVLAECERVHLPAPEVTPLDLRGVPRLGLVARMRLSFRRAVSGPIVLGRDRHFGGGLFEARPGD